MIALAIGGAIWNGAGIAQGVVIDDFSVGAITVPGPAIQTQTGLDPAHVLGGSRAFNVGQFGTGSVLEIDPANGLEFHSSGWGYFAIKYDFVNAGAGIDLTQGGHDRFRLQFGDIDTTTFTPLGLYVTLPPNSSNHGVSLYVGNWDDLILEFPFSAFPTTVSNAQNLTLDVFRNHPGAALNLTSIATAGPPLAGDYDRDGIVDGQDYLVWRRFQGISTRNGLHWAIASADGNGDGLVDAADYILWRKSMAADLAGGAAANLAVPEPASLMLVAAFLPAAMRRYGRWPQFG